MGNAILSSLAGEDMELFFYDPDKGRASKIQATAVSSIEEGFSKADIAFLCIKPQVFQKLHNFDLKKPCTVISIMAGISISNLQRKFENARIVRTMPNIAIVAKSGTVAIATDGAEESVLQMVEQLFSKCATTVRVSESHMDAVTGLSGSGPAFAFQFIDALAMGGVKMGLPHEVAMKLAQSTVSGASRMLQESELSSGALTASVCSPGGTTIAGIQELENKAFRGIVMTAVETAAKRSMELGK